MLIDFLYTLRSAKLPVSVKEYLTLVEALHYRLTSSGAEAPNAIKRSGPCPTDNATACGSVT